jgi:hypothetical protein
MKRDYEQAKYEHPVDDINWTAGVGQPAGMYWLDGRVVMAAHESVAEQRLLLRGALLVATLRFDPDPLERVLHGRRVERVAAGPASRALLRSGVN